MRTTPASPTPTATPALVEAALADLTDTPTANDLAGALSAQDLEILEAVREAVEAAHRRFAASRAGRERDADLWTARLGAAASRLGRAALGL